jgi:mannose-1-phosphate guanylyltransferase
MIRTVDPDATVTIATSKTQVSAINNQLGESVGISIEPCRRDTFPAIALATAYLADVMHVPSDEAVVVCPVDPYVEEDYFEALKTLCDRAASGSANLVLMGMEPTYPSEKYGYIMSDICEANVRHGDATEGGVGNTASDLFAPVSEFKEKPDLETAKSYLAQGALWNGGVFAYKLSYVLDKAHELIDFTDYNDLFSKYDTLTKISFDYAVVEKEKNIEVMRFSGQWKDLGTWNTLTEAMEEPVIGEAVLNDKCEDVHVINELNVPVLAMGIKNAVICASAQGILVSDKSQSSYIKPFVDKIDNRIMFSEKSWGSYRVIAVEEGSMTVMVTLNPGHGMHYHSHKLRDEVWTVISGSGTAIIDEVVYPVKPGDVLRMRAGQKHKVSAKTELKIIEVQIGDEISVQDKEKF